MPYGMYISAAGAQAQSERLKVLSNNLANVDTAGFKPEFAVFQARHAEAIVQGEEHAGTKSINDLGGGLWLAETVTDFDRGTLRQTGNPTDLAINGDGFFMVERDGEKLLTRAGNFQFSPEGRMITQQGYSVLSMGGEPIQMDPRIHWEMNENGAIDQGGARIYLALVKPRSLGDLVKAGENMFSPIAPVTPVPGPHRHIKTGFLESSTVKPALEMMELIETSRAYEANIRMIQSQDQALGSLLSRVLRPA